MKSLAELSLGTPDQVYEQVADVLREYLQARFDIPASDMTTVEIRTGLENHTELESEHITEVARLLEQADLVKFAEAAPGERSAQRAVAAAARVPPGKRICAETRSAMPGVKATVPWAETASGSSPARPRIMEMSCGANDHRTFSSVRNFPSDRRLE